MAMPKDECAAGIYPLQGDARKDPSNQFTPVDLSPVKNGLVGFCRLCEQWTMVKKVAPRKGYFVWHKSSTKGHVPQRFQGSGTPARTRGRRG